MAAMAPYLARLEPEAEFTDWVLKEGWGEHWGVFAVAPADLRAMRQHFRTLLTVLTPDNKTAYFRYYDPRVLRVFLPICNDEEIGQLFGPIAWYGLEDEDPGHLIRFRRDSGSPRQEQVDLSQRPMT